MRRQLVSATLAFALALSLVGAHALSTLESGHIYLRRARQHAPQREVLYVPRHGALKLLTLGFEQAAADLLWVRTLQYFVDHLFLDRKYRWLSHFVDQIIALDPRFEQVYLWAGSCILYGQVVTDEVVQASNHFYEAAAERFPERYEAPFHLGMNYYIELRGETPEDRAAYQALGIAWLERAALASDAPTHLPALLRGIAAQDGRDEVLLYYLTESMLRSDDPEEIRRFQERIEEIHERRLRSGEAPLHHDSLARLERRRLERAPYLRPLTFELLDEPAFAPLDWRSLLRENL